MLHTALFYYLKIYKQKNILMEFTEQRRKSTYTLIKTVNHKLQMECQHRRGKRR